MKNELLKQQPKLLQLLANAKKNNAISHAYLLDGDEQNDFDTITKFMVKTIVCENDELACENCNTCMRIEHGNYSDVISYDASKEKVGKDEILKIKNTLVKTAQEDNKKIYIIKNVDEVTSSALNALLLFLEEPVEDVVAIFTTTKLNKVLTTIKSRCQIIKLKSSDQTVLYDELLEQHSSLEAHYLSFFNDQDREEVVELFPKFLGFVKKYIIKDITYIIDLYEDIFKDKQRETLNIFLQLMKIFINDVYANKNYDDNDYAYLINNFNQEECAKILLISSQIKDNNFKGSNIKLLVDKLVFLLEEPNE